jgi:hypothetical protein
VNELSGDLVLFLALLVMVALVAIPQRCLRLAAVLGWAALWVDDKLSGHWSDWLGAGVVIGSLTVVVLKRRHPTGPGGNQV